MRFFGFEGEKSTTQMWLIGLALVLAPLAATAQSRGIIGPFFSKAFDPSTIGPGSVSMLTFRIDNTKSGSSVGNLAFTDTLPPGMTIATPAAGVSGCSGVLTAPDGGGTISFTDGQVAGDTACTIQVNVTASSFGTLMNVSGDLTSDNGNSGSAQADLFVSALLPGFTKGFSPSTVGFGGRSTLTFIIDNTSNDLPVVTLDFTDNLPTGMVVAGPANASTDCGTPQVPPVLTAVPGSSTITLFANGTVQFPAVGSGASCTVSVDVIGGAVGSLGNVSGELLAFVNGQQQSAGKASAVLEVFGSESPLLLSKAFTDDPVAPGGAVTLELTLTNRDRGDAATSLALSDDLEATLSGLAPSGALPADPCGAGSALDFTSGVLNLTGGTLPPEDTCTFSVLLAVPAGAAAGDYPNTAGPATGDVGGSPESSNVAGDVLFVVPFPLLTKEFIDDPVGAGSPVTLEFTITNSSTDWPLEQIEFIDELTTFLPFPVSVGLPPVPDPPCGPGSDLQLVSLGTERQGLELTGGSLAEAGMAGDSCTFSVTVDIPAGFPEGTYTNTTGPISGVLFDGKGGPMVTGPGASDDLEVVGPPRLLKEFTDDPVLPGDPVTLEFTVSHDALAVGDATAIAFTDDLDATLTGLTLTSVLVNDCGGTASGVGTGLFGYTGGTLTPGASCTISVSLTVPAGALPGFKTNTTSEISATVAGVGVTGNPATDDLLVTGLTFSKDFIDDPALPGGTTTLRFTLDNASPTDDATSIAFSDDLDETLAGLVAVVLPPNPCGPGSSIIGTSVLDFSGGELTAGTSCSFDVTLSVPAGAADNSYLNVTSPLFAIVAGQQLALDPASALLVVDGTRLEIVKAFTDDPVAPGDSVTLEFTLTNLDAVNPASDIAFDDDLATALPGLTVTGALFNDCGGMGGGFGTEVFSYSGGSLGAGASCTIRLDLAVPAGPLPGGPFVNVSGEVTGTITDLPVRGEPATDELLIQLLSLAKSFDGPSVPGGSAVLTFTIENLDADNGASPLSFSDDLSAVIPGLVASVLPPTPCGAESAITGTTFLAFSGGSLGPSGTCSFDVTVDVPAGATAGSFLNTTSDLVSSGLPVADPATAFLEVEPPPTFAKAFAPGMIPQGGVSTLTFTIDNGGSALAATGLDFTDNLPAPVVVANPANASTTCTGGTLTAVPGTGVIAYTGGSVAAGAVCTVEAAVTSSTVGIHVNVTGDLTSSSGNSGTATDDLEVFDGIPPQLVLVDSIRGTGDGELEECETARTPISALLATFDEPMYNPGSSTDPNSVTNPDNWLVIASGPDRDLSTTACGPPAGDDEVVSILEVTYAPATLMAAVQFDGTLGDAPHRLLACSGGLADESLNPLDGDANGSGGDDFVRTFRVDEIDAFSNGHFDCTLEDWIPVPLGGSTIEHDPAMDVDDASISGSAHFTNQAGSTQLALGQCADLLPQAVHEFSGSVYLETAGVSLQVLRACQFFTAGGCAGSALPAQVFFDTVSTTGVWIGFDGDIIVPQTGHSALCQVTLRNLPGLAFEAFLDDVSLDLIQAPILFADGFESGDTSAWSVTVP